jgi:hypothetical protein
MWVRQLIPPAVPKINPFFDSLGSAYLAPTGKWWRHNGVVWQELRTDPDSAIWATRYYTDSGLASISAGAVDTNNYIASITRLNTEIDSIANIIDSNNTIIYGAISALYDTKADKDTLTNFLLKSDTATLSNRINLKQNYSDTTTFDATRYWVSTQIPSLAGYVPYTGATTDLDLGTHTISARTGVINKPSGSGVGLSVTKGGNGEALTVTKTSGSGNAMSVTGGVTQLSELHTTTKIADAYIASALNWNGKYDATDTGRGTTNIVTGGSLNKVRDSLAALNTGGTVTSIQLVGGTGVTITPTIAATTVGVFTISATGGGGGSPTTATNPQILYKSGTDTLKGATRVNIDSTDGRLVLINNLDTSAVLSFSGGGTKISGSNTFGTIKIMDTASLRAELQRAVNVVAISQVLAFNVLNFTNKLSISGQTPSVLGTQGTVYADYNATIQHLNYGKVTLTTTASANQNAGLRYPTTSGAAGIITGNTRFSGGGGKGTFMFALPAYNSGHRLIVGYSRVTTALSGDPTTFMETLSPRVPLIGIGKDAADTTLQWMFRNSELASAVTKVNTGVIPNADDMYIVTIYVSPSSNYILKLEVMSKTGTSTHIYQPLTNTPPVGTKLIPFFQSNSGLGSVATVLGVIQFTEEIY